MRLTKVLDMDEYFMTFPDKRPNLHGSLEQQLGDNMYFRENGRWLRMLSAEHNSVRSFKQDQGRRVYLAEGANNFWYFGATNPMSEIQGFADRFPWLIQDRQGLEYVDDAERIQTFVEWLSSLEATGLLGQPRDQNPIAANRYLTAIDPVPVWHESECDARLGRSDAPGRTYGTARSR